MGLTYKAIQFINIMFFTCVVAVSCNKEAGTISLGDDHYDELGADIADTLSIEASTYLLDALPTAGTGRILAGMLDDEALGSMNVSSYFRVDYEANATEYASGAVFDSLSLSLFYDHYYYGDTLSPLHLAVYRLSEDLALSTLSVALEDDEYPVFASGETLWSNQSFAYDPTPLGETVFRPRPNIEGDTVRIRLDDALGADLFAMAKENDTRLTVSDDFINYFKGLVLVPQAGKSIIGFQDSIEMKVHYSYERQSDGMRVSESIRFVISAASYQFNQVETVRAGTAMESLSAQNKEIFSSETQHQTYIQGFSGLVTRLRFPYLKEFLNHTNIAVNQAQLIIETDRSQYSLYAPPNYLNAMIANKQGTPTSMLLTSYSDGNQAAYFQYGGLDGGAGNGKYVFDLTQYVSEFQNSGEDQSLLLTIPLSNMMNTVDRVSIASQGDRPAIKLHILYTKF